jgi:hypothetical protein
MTSLPAGFLHRHALARQHGFVHAAVSIRHNAVKRDLAARFYKHHIPDVQRFRRNLLLCAPFG